MKKTLRKRLTLNEETIRSLTGPSLRHAVGGGWTIGPSGTISIAEGDCTETCPSAQITQCAGLCTTNPWTARCVPV